jgi:hypothetical protein
MQAKLVLGPKGTQHAYSVFGTVALRLMDALSCGTFRCHPPGSARVSFDSNIIVLKQFGKAQYAECVRAVG